MTSTLNPTLLITNKSDEKDSFDSTKKLKEYVERNKANNSPNNTESRDVKQKTRERKCVLKYWMILC